MTLKKWLALVLCASFALCGISAASADVLADIQKRGKLVVGAEVSFPPYEFYYENPETGVEELAGFEMKLAQGVADALGVELELADQGFAGLITALRAGELDAIISGMSIKPDRQEVVDFSDPYYGGKQIVLTRKADVDKFAAPEDFAGINIGAQTGSLQQGIAEEQFATANTILLDRVPLLIMELRLGNIDGLLVTDNVALTYTTLFPEELAITDVPVVYQSPGVGIAVAKGDNASLLEAINTYIAAVKADGTFDAWVEEAIGLNAKLVEIQLESEE